MRPFLVLILAAAAVPAPPARADGAAIYVEQCATCHGKDGGGDGPLAADLQFRPRAFKEGKFAFGDTPEAIARTVRSGIPGQEKMRMPAFREVLTEAEVAEVVAYVSTLFPARRTRVPADLRLDVRDQARIVRGILPGLRKGDPPRARGMLVGVPSGFTFEYALDDFRLVAVRRGLFVDRSDWMDRGGQPLTPLGTPVLRLAEPEGWKPFALESGDGSARLRSTATHGAGAELRFEIVDRSGKVRAHGLERPRPVVVEGGAGIVQELELRAAGERARIRCSLAFPVPMTAVEPSVEEGWWVLGTSEGTFVCVRIDAPGGTPEAVPAGDARALDVVVEVGDAPVVVRRTLIVRKDADPERLRAMSAELR
jgi:mono/diheme cytochrome c family protein